jgi:hypothetical protein
LSPSDDPSDDMARFPSSAQADRLLGGHLAASDLPDEGTSLARLLEDLVPEPAHDPFTERRIVSEMMTEIRRVPDGSVVPHAAGGLHVPVKAAALAFVAVLATGTAAAAANGSLPPRIQRAVSDALSHVAISVPRPAPHRTPPVETPHGGTDGSQNGGSPDGATGPVSPRGVHDGDHNGTTPRGVTKPTSRGTTGANGPTGPTGTNGNNGRHVGTPTTVPHGPGTTNPNKGSGNNAGNHNGTGQGQHKGAGKGKKTGQSSTPTTTVPLGKGKKNTNGADNGNAGGNGKAQASGRASFEVPGTGARGS